jgi:choline-sulfatase
MVGLRNERYKLTLCAADPPILTDLEADPCEMTNLAHDPAAASVFEALREEAARRWDLMRFDAAVRESQARRHIVYTALRNGAYFPWDYQPLQKASERYMRNHMDLNILEESQRFPRGE